MHIKELHLKNFRCFEDNIIKFNRRFNLIIGNNGFGKTSVLEAIAVGISSYINDIKSLSYQDKRNIQAEDVRIIRGTGLSEVTDFIPCYPVELGFKTVIDDKAVKFSRIKKDKSARSTFDNKSSIKVISKNANDALVNEEKKILPAFAYHGTGRIWAKTSAHNSDSRKSRVEGYERCINPMSNENQYTKWIRDRRLYELDEQTSSTELATLYKAAESFLGEGSKVSYKSKEKEIIVTLPSGQILPFNMLSDGYKNALGIVFDTAFRMIRLNPWLKEDAIDKTPGIILIDEIDLHLHPTWQKKIVEDIKRVFPKMQIIATTHAPIVISSCKADELIILDSYFEDMKSYVNIKESISPKGWMTESILDKIMDVPTSRDSETEKQINEYRELYIKKTQSGLSEKEIKNLKKLEKYLESILPTEDPVLAMIRIDAID